jgi:nitrogen fixation NifU-like protein
MKNLFYNKTVLKYFKNPKNMGEMKNPDSIGMAGNPICGDIMKIYLKIGKNKQNKKYIKDIKFQTMGCAAAIATSSMITQLAKGKTLEKAEKISNKDVAKKLGGLPPLKMHCSNLASNALKKAIENYKNE